MTAQTANAAANVALSAPNLKSIASKTVLTAALALSAITMIAAAPASADDATEWRNRIIDSRLAEQDERIRNGRRSGQLTWLEAQRLRQEQRRVARLQREAMADDGRIDRHEFRVINEAQNESARHIREERTDTQRPWWSYAERPSYSDAPRPWWSYAERPSYPDAPRPWWNRVRTY